MGIVETSRANLLRILAREIPRRPSDGAVAEGADAQEDKHKNPAWVRRCVASYVQKGGLKKKAPGGLNRDDVSEAFAICRAQYNEFDNPEEKNAEAKSKKKFKTRMGQYEKILAKAKMSYPP